MEYKQLGTFLKRVIFLTFIERNHSQKEKKKSKLRKFIKSILDIKIKSVELMIAYLLLALTNIFVQFTNFITSKIFRSHVMTLVMTWKISMPFTWP